MRLAVEDPRYSEAQAFFLIRHCFKCKIQSLFAFINNPVMFQLHYISDMPTTPFLTIKIFSLLTY